MKQPKFYASLEEWKKYYIWQWKKIVANKDTTDHYKNYAKTVIKNLEYVGLKYMDREGDILEVYNFDTELNKFLVREENNKYNLWADYLLTLQEIEEEIKPLTQELRRNFYKGSVVLA